MCCAVGGVALKDERPPRMPLAKGLAFICACQAATQKPDTHHLQPSGASAAICRCSCGGPR
jgi:hypothetical protein